MKKDKVIGIISGMGPHAGLDLAAKIFNQTAARRDQDHLPVAILSYPERLVDRTSFLFDEIDTNPAFALAEIARQLESVGAVVAGMPCNTAHAAPILDVIRAELRRTGHRIEILSIIDETVRSIREAHPELQRVGVLGTTAVYRLRLYRDALAAAGITPVVPDPERQERLVNATIFDETWGLKVHSDPPTDEARARLLEAIEHLKDDGAQAVILGCTELPLVIPEPEIFGLPTIDPTAILARSLIRATYPEALAQPAESHGG